MPEKERKKHTHTKEGKKSSPFFKSSSAEMVVMATNIFPRVWQFKQRPILHQDINAEKIDSCFVLAGILNPDKNATMPFVLNCKYLGLSPKL